MWYKLTLTIHLLISWYKLTLTSPRACLDGGVNGVKEGIFYLQHPNMRVKEVEVNVLPPKFALPLFGCQIEVKLA